jgi:hypothetical protein
MKSKTMHRERHGVPDRLGVLSTSQKMRCSEPDPVAHLWHGVSRQGPKTAPGPRIRLGHFTNYYKEKSVELTGFESVTPSLRKMRSKRPDQGF